MLAKPENKTQPAPRKKENRKNNILEIDLHINELLDTTSGMSNADMLNYQLDKFHAILAENAGKKGQKIVFIHGKGEGVLRKEIENQLKTRYRAYYFQDASFREYGFGATMITIH
jgi:dsDNA-specific endonuclease/ATPase MutS2